MTSECLFLGNVTRLLHPGDPAMMHEVLDLLKAAHLKVPKTFFTTASPYLNIFLPPLYFSVAFNSSSALFHHGVFIFVDLELSFNLQATFFITSSYVKREGGREVRAVKND
jgi:hypothetical protein